MELSLLDWVSLIANIVTILGIGGLFTAYRNKKNSEKQIANETLASAIKSASLKLNLYNINSKKIYRAVDTLDMLKNRLREWRENIIDFGIDTDWQSEKENNLPDFEKKLFGYSSYIDKDDEDADFTNYSFDDYNGNNSFNHNEMQVYLISFNKLPSNKRKDILSYAVKNSHVQPMLNTINRSSIISDEDLHTFIDSILIAITSDGLAYNSFAKKAFIEFRDFQLSLEELSLYEKQYIGAIVNDIIKLDNPFLFFQEKWNSENPLPIKFSEKEYIAKRLSIVKNLLSLITNIEGKLPQ